MTEQPTVPSSGAPAPAEKGAGGRGPREGGRPESGKREGRGERGGRRPGGPGGGGRRFYRRRKVCRFCTERVDHIDYKDVKLIGQFVGDRGKILPRRLTGVCTPHQRQLKVAIKRARNIALLPFAVSL